VVRPVHSLSSPSTLPEKLAERLAMEIFTKKYPPGSPFPSEREWVKVLKVSRTTVREALKQLSVWGFIKTYQGKGSFVTHWEKEGTLEILALYIRLGLPGLSLERFLPTALRLRRVPIVEGVYWLAKHPNPSYFRLKQLLKSAWDEKEDPTRFLKKDYEFVQNFFLESEFYPGLWILNQSYQVYLQVIHSFPFPPPVPARYYSTWLSVLNLCERREGEKGANLLRRYFEEIDKNLLKLFGIKP